jgi:hypothetical protein
MQQRQITQSHMLLSFQLVFELNQTTYLITVHIVTMFIYSTLQNGSNLTDVNSWYTPPSATAHLYRIVKDNYSHFKMVDIPDVKEKL